RQMLKAFPYVPLWGSIRITVAIFSYNGQVNFGVTGDYDTAADVDVLCRGIERGLHELVDIARSREHPIALGGSPARREKRAPRPGDGAQPVRESSVALDQLLPGDGRLQPLEHLAAYPAHAHELAPLHEQPRVWKDRNLTAVVEVQVCGDHETHISRVQSVL